MARVKLLLFDIQFLVSVAADALLGPRCDRCAQRVYSRDRLVHDQDCD